MFKIGIGPSSSHTVGPMKAGKQFADDLVKKNMLTKVARITVEVYGSLALTGKGHHTDRAIILGLAGNSPDTVPIDTSVSFLRDVSKRQKLRLAGTVYEINFSPDKDIVFYYTNLARHENGLRIHAFSQDTCIYSQTYYSIGGGFIVEEAQFNRNVINEVRIPFNFTNANQLLKLCRDNALSISDLVLCNELELHKRSEIDHYFSSIWHTMRNCIERGIHTDGTLPGPLQVPRRASMLRRMLISEENNIHTDPMKAMDWVNMFALAVNEENASGGRVVTAPTNGACGIVPAILAYYDHFIKPVSAEIWLPYFLTSGAIGILYKINASISGAEVGCQGEIGVACSMAAAGLTELIGGSPEQVCIAAEIAMEHNLGLTCDPVGGQVQIPCIERNAIAAVKAINASRMAMHRTSSPRVSLDQVIETMYATGKDMSAKYRETARGGLAVKVKCI